MTTRRCRACDDGTIEPFAEPGRAWKYKRLVLEVPADFEIPTCSSCGEMWLDPERAEALDATLERQYEDAIAARVSEAIDRLRAHRSQRRLEALLGLSHGYLSKLLSRTKAPSDALLTTLMMMAVDPETRIREAEALWNEPGVESRTTPVTARSKTHR